MWHWPHVVGRRAISTDAVWRVWQAVQLQIDPSAFGLPTPWHLTHPLTIDAGPSRSTKEFAGRLQDPGWNFSANATCSTERPFSPYTAAQDGAAWRLRKNCWYSVSWQLRQLAAVTFFAMTNPW